MSLHPESGNRTVAHFSQNIGQNVNDIDRLIEKLRELVQTFPEMYREQALVHLDDLQDDIATPEKQKPERIKTRIASLLAIATTLATVVAGATDFGNNVLELADKFGFPPEVFIQTSSLQSPAQSGFDAQIDLAAQGIDLSQAEILRSSLMTFADDWNSSDMSIYDNYDAARANLESR